MRSKIFIIAGYTFIAATALLLVIYNIMHPDKTQMKIFFDLWWAYIGGLTIGIFLIKKGINR